MNPLSLIIDKHQGSKSLLAKRLKELYPTRTITPTHISNWLNRDNKVPAEWIIPLCETVNFEVTPNSFDSTVYRHAQDGLPEHLRSVA